MKRTPSPIVVVPFPPVLPQNPYLDLLYGAMRDTSIRVQRERLRTSLPRLLFGRGNRVLHLHFFDEFVQRPSMPATAVRSLGFLMMLLLLRLRGVRLAWTAHNLGPHEQYHATWSFFVYRLLVRWCDALIFHSEAARDMFVARCGLPRRAEIIPHGNYIGVYGPQVAQAEARAALKLPQGSLLLAFGALRRYKNLEGLIDAFEALPAEQRGTLLIAGTAKSASYGAAIERRAAQVPGVVVHGEFIPNGMLPQYLAAADAVVVPYHSLVSSGMLLCALSYVRPVIAPDTAPVRELVCDGVEGWLFAPGQLKTALARSLAQPDHASMGTAAFQRARLFDWPTIAARTAQVYAHVCR